MTNGEQAACLAATSAFSGRPGLPGRVRQLGLRVGGEITSSPDSSTKSAPSLFSAPPTTFSVSPDPFSAPPASGRGPRRGVVFPSRFCQHWLRPRNSAGRRHRNRSAAPRRAPPAGRPGPLGGAKSRATHTRHPARAVGDLAPAGFRFKSSCLWPNRIG